MVPVHGEGTVGPMCAGVDGHEPLDEESVRKSAKKLLQEQQPQVRVGRESKSKDDWLKREPEKQKPFASKNYPNTQFDYMYLSNKDTPAIVAIDSWTHMSRVAPMTGKRVTNEGVD